MIRGQKVIYQIIRRHDEDEVGEVWDTVYDFHDAHDICEDGNIDYEQTGYTYFVKVVEVEPNENY